MMSGPAPTCAATIALGRRSSLLTESTCTCTPVFSVNFAVLRVHTLPSASMKRVQRSTRSLAPFSGVGGGEAANPERWAARAAAAPAAPRMARRVTRFIGRLPLGHYRPVAKAGFKSRDYGTENRDGKGFPNS